MQCFVCKKEISDEPIKDIVNIEQGNQNMAMQDEATFYFCSRNCQVIHEMFTDAVFFNYNLRQLCKHLIKMHNITLNELRNAIISKPFIKYPDGKMLLDENIG